MRKFPFFILVLLSLLCSCNEDEKVTPKVAAPSEFAIKSVSESQIELKWLDNSNNETGFFLERSKDSLRFEGVELPANTTTFIDKKVDPSTKYYYRIASVLNDVFSTSITLSASTPGLKAPSNFEVTAVSSSRIDLKWRDNSTDESGFRLARSTDNKNFEIIELPANTTVYSDQGLSALTKYYYEISAVSTTGSSPKINASVTTPEATLESELIGVWTLVGVNYFGQPFPLEECHKDNTWEFFTNQTCMLAEGNLSCGGWEGEGTWSPTAESEISVTLNGETTVVKINEITHQSLVLEISDAEGTVIYSFKR